MQSPETSPLSASLICIALLVLASLFLIGDTQRTVATTSTIILPPYLDLVVFDVVRATSATEPLLYPPGSAQPLDKRHPGVQEVQFGNGFSTIAVHRPPAGIWQVRTRDPRSRVTVLSQRFFPRGVLVSPDSGTRLQIGDRCDVAYRFVDPAGDAFDEIPGQALRVKLILITPDGRRVRIPMSRDATSAAFRSDSALECTNAGRYWTRVFATVVDAVGREICIFEDRWSGFTVDTASCAHCTPEESNQQSSAL
jgi:hypothetical protein